MKHAIVVGITCLLLSTCATLLNTPITHITIESNRATTLVVAQDTLGPSTQHHTLTVPRSGQPLPIRLESDSVTKHILLPSKTSYAYWLNAYPTPLLFTGFWFDRNRPERYTYPKRIYVDMTSPRSEYRTYDFRSRFHHIYVQSSIPYINQFLLNPDPHLGYKEQTGFWGLQVGIMYYNRPHHFIHVSFSAVTDFFLPVLAPYEPGFGRHESMYSVAVSLTQNVQWHHWSVGAGLHLAQQIWRVSSYDTLSPPSATHLPQRQAHISLGISVPVYYQLGEHFSLGVLYNPTFFALNRPQDLRYEHVLSLEMAWSIPIYKPHG